MIAQTGTYPKYKRKNWIDHSIANSKTCSKIHPLYLTLIQLPLLWIVVWMFDNGWIFSSFFVLGAIVWPLDWFDGRFARIFGKETQAGAFLDPLVDKIRFLVPITYFFSEIIWIPLIVLFWLIEGLLVVTRVVKIVSSRKKQKKARINAFSVGKVKAWGEMIGLLLVYLFYMTEAGLLLWLAYIVLIPSLVLACLSLYNHVTK